MRRPRWHVRAFRAWLRAVPPGLGEGAEDDIVALFEQRLEAEGRTRLGRLILLGHAMTDALRHGPSAATDAPRSARSGVSTGDRIAAVWQDARFAFRSLRRRRVFSGLAITALGLGIGGTTAMFTVIDGVLIKQLPYPDPGSVVSVWKAWPSWQGQEGLDYTWDHIHFPWVDAMGVRQAATAFEIVGVHAQATTVLTGEGPAEMLAVGEADHDLFPLLGVRPVIGRTFLPHETAASGTPAPVVLLSHQLLDRRFGRDEGVLGRTVRLGRGSFEVIGVLPERFRLESDLVSTHDNGGGVDPGLRQV